MTLCLLMCFALSAVSQQAATLSGRVLDPKDAVIVGATVTATNKATGTKREVTTNGEGIYVLTNLAPGEYEVSAQAASFSRTSHSPVGIGVGQNVTLDLTLHVPGTNVDPEVVSDFASLVSTNTSVVDGVINRHVIENLPLNGRNFLELALLIPGNTPAPNFDPTKTNSVIISSAGQLGRGGNVTIDGTDNNDDAVGGPLLNVSQDAVQEFQIATNRFSAELGRSASSVINVVTK
ncbi:MAG TPA: carboxypeptidase-like regulatory domain-containing protein, partial [Blastocatellia bacterium]|nr:carboxypeptidase-like regulatory domain-containing protein [Blastocatellia bacterium]